jgi:putative transposase
LAGSSKCELRCQIQYLKAENEILRSKINGPVRITRPERTRLIRLAKPLGSVIKAMTSIVAPRTFLRWIREADSTRPRKRTGRKPGRPRTSVEIHTLILKLARETDWGYTRIFGELKKLGVRVSRATVVNTLREAGVPNGPQRGETTWAQFIHAHAETLWACDFIQHRVLTPRGMRDAFVLVFINITTRRTVASASTFRPDSQWVVEQVRLFRNATQDTEMQCRVLTRDRDTKFGQPFDSALQLYGITPVRLPPRSPNLNAHIERFIQTVRLECLDKFISLGTAHLDYLLAEFLIHYNAERPHSAIGARPPMQAMPPATPPLQLASSGGRLRCKQRLGGVLKHYYRTAA